MPVSRLPFRIEHTRGDALFLCGDTNVTWHSRLGWFWSSGLNLDLLASLLEIHSWVCCLDTSPPEEGICHRAMTLYA